MVGLGWCLILHLFLHLLVHSAEESALELAWTVFPYHPGFQDVTAALRTYRNAGIVLRGICNLLVSNDSW